MHKKIRMTGAGCVRADRYGTFEVGGREVLPFLLVTLEVWQHPLTVQGNCRGQEECV